MNAQYATKQDLQTLKTELSADFHRAITHAIEALGQMIKGGFDQVTEAFGRVYQRFDAVDREIGHMKLRLDHAAYRFELVELEKRVDTLERKTGIQRV